MPYAVTSFVHGEPTTQVHPSSVQKLGIEIEVENVRASPGPFNPPLVFWNVTTDGSLRNNGAEFVSKILEAGQIEDALKDFYVHWKQQGMQTNLRCGIHVHMNCLPFMVPDLAGIFTTYALLEPFLMSVCGDLREENIYCVPWYRSTLEADKAALLVRDPKERWPTLRAAVNQACKYAALNFATLAKFGTLEFRHAPTWDSITPTLSWTQMLLRIMEYGVKRNPTEILDAWHRDPEAWYRLVLGKFCPTVMHDHVQLAEEVGAVSVAEKFLPYSKTKAQNWGAPPLNVQGTGHERYAMTQPQSVAMRGESAPRPPREPRRPTRVTITEAAPAHTTTWRYDPATDMVRPAGTTPPPPPPELPMFQAMPVMNESAADESRDEQEARHLERIDRMLRGMAMAAERRR